METFFQVFVENFTACVTCKFFYIGVFFGAVSSVFYYEKLGSKSEPLSEKQKSERLSQARENLDRALSHIKNKDWNPVGTLDYISANLFFVTSRRLRRKILAAVELAAKEYKNNPDKAADYIHLSKSYLRNFA